MNTRQQVEEYALIWNTGHFARLFWRDRLRATRRVSFAGGDVASQTGRRIEIVADFLSPVDLAIHDIARCTVDLADINDFDAMNAMSAERFGDEYPARRTSS